jgi:hypothetical protein
MREMADRNGPMMGGAMSVTPDIQEPEAMGSLRSTIHSSDALMEETTPVRDTMDVEEGSGGDGWHRTRTWLSSRTRS